MVADDALVAALMIEGDVTEVKDGGVLHYSSVTGPHMGEVLHLSLPQSLLVLAPGEGHRRATAAGRSAGETNIFPQYCCR